MDIVRGFALSSDSDKDSDNSESSDIEVLDSSDVCGDQRRDWPSHSCQGSCNLIQTGQRKESGGSDTSTTQKKSQSL